MRQIFILLLLTFSLFANIPTYTYNNHNKLTKTTYPDGSTTSSTYDAMDNLLSETNQEGETSSYAYDDADRLIKTTQVEGSGDANAIVPAGKLLNFVASASPDPVPVPFLFLIKPTASESDALKKIFAEYNVPLQINYIFDF